MTLNFVFNKFITFFKISNCLGNHGAFKRMVKMMGKIWSNKKNCISFGLWIDFWQRHVFFVTMIFWFNCKAFGNGKLFSYHRKFSNFPQSLYMKLPNSQTSRNWIKLFSIYHEFSKILQIFLIFQNLSTESSDLSSWAFRNFRSSKYS